MIVVDREKCRGCGLCVQICHQHCMTLNNGIVSVNHELCSTCTQCIAVCPQQGLSWDTVPPVAYDRTLLPSAEQLNELFKERRTIRFFKREKIDRMLLGEIIGCGIYAPTTNYALRAVVVDNEEIIKELEQISIQFNLRVYKLFVKPKLVFNLIGRITPALNPKIKAKFEHRRHTYFNPAAMVFIVGDKRIGLSEASAQYALYNMMLYAQVKGIGSCLWGAGKISLARSKTARKRLGLRKHEHILGTLLLGYPTVRFSNKVQGKTLSIEWIEGRNGLANVPKARRVQPAYAAGQAIGQVTSQKIRHLSNGKTPQMPDASGRVLFYAQACSQLKGY